jgi:acyl carrier protein
MNESERELREVVVDGLASRLRLLGVAREAVDDDLDLFASGILDSLSLIDLLMSVEQRLGQTLDFESMDFTRLVTLGVLVEQLHRLLDTAKVGYAA